MQNQLEFLKIFLNLGGYKMKMIKLIRKFLQDKGLDAQKILKIDQNTETRCLDICFCNSKRQLLEYSIKGDELREYVTKVVVK